MATFFQGNGHEVRVQITGSNGDPITSGTVVLFVRDLRGAVVGEEAGYPLEHQDGGLWSASLEPLPLQAGARYEVTVEINAPGVPVQRIDQIVTCSKRRGS